LLPGAADSDAEAVIGQRRRRDRVVDPFVARRIDVELGAERTRLQRAFRTLINDRALRTRVRQGVGVALDEVLASFGADLCEEKTQMGEHRIVSANRLARLQ